MAVLGRLLRHRHAGEDGLAWHRVNLAGPETLALTSPDFEHGGAIPTVHASRRVGGSDLSPALAWSGVPDGTAQLLFVLEDPDAPSRVPIVHTVALLAPSLDRLDRGGLAAGGPADGVRLLRGALGSAGYRGPAPIRGHGPHRYVFQLFALGTPIAGVAPIESARPPAVLGAGSDVLARGRLDGRYERP